MSVHGGRVDTKRHPEHTARARASNGRGARTGSRPPRPTRPSSPRPSSTVRRTTHRARSSQRVVNRRLGVLLAVFLAAFAVVSGRLVFVQAVASDRYAAYGEAQRLRTVTLATARGSIFDRNGKELALSVDRPTIWANPRLVTDPIAEAAALAPLLGIDELELRDRLRKDAAFVYLARTVDESTARAVEALRLDGVFFVDEPLRFRPSGDLAAPVVGVVGTDNVGLGGLELKYDEVLRGTPGKMRVELDPSGKEIPGGLREIDPPTRGDDLILTLDRSLQFETEQALSAAIVEHRAEGGIAIVMETRTGDVLAMANMVAGDEGAPPKPAPSASAVTHVHEPGSVNKLITIAAALEEGIVHRDDKLTVPYTIQVADKTFKEHDYHPTEEWSITDIVARSSNVGSIMIGQELGKARLDRYLREFGFGSKTAIGFPGESGGIMLDPEKWSGTSIGTISIGQGIAVTGLQMLAAYNTVANGGVYVPPRLVHATVGPDGEQRELPAGERRRVVSETTAADMAAMLAEVVRAGTGTAAAIDGYTVAGKTGTARKPNVGAPGYEPGAYVSSFAGFVPAEDPALAVIVMLDEPRPVYYGGLVAAPTFARISKYALRQFRIPPPQAALRAVPAIDGKAPDVGEPGAPAPGPNTTLPGATPQPAPTPSERSSTRARD